MKYNVETYICIEYDRNYLHPRDNKRHKRTIYIVPKYPTNRNLQGPVDANHMQLYRQEMYLQFDRPLYFTEYYEI